MDVTIEQVDAAAGSAQVSLAGVNISLPSRGMEAGPAKLAVRPNRLELKGPDEAGGLPGKVIKCTYVGNHMEYVVRLAQGEWFATSDDVDAVHEAGAEVSVHFRARGPVLLSA